MLASCSADSGYPTSEPSARSSTRFDLQCGHHDRSYVSGFVIDEITVPIRSSIQTHLRRVAAAATTTTYQALANELGLKPPNTILQLTSALEALMREDAAESRPFIAALVVSKRPPYLPGRGFFQCAAELGRFSGNLDEAHAFHSQELESAQRYWARM